MTSKRDEILNELLQDVKDPKEILGKLSVNPEKQIGRVYSLFLSIRSLSES